MRVALVTVGLLWAAGCGGGASGSPDAAPAADAAHDGADDAATADGALDDAAPPDGTIDAATTDGAMADGAAPDAAMPDAAVPDAAMPDAAMPDAAMPEAAMPDAAMADASACGALAADPAAVYVDGGATTPSVGTQPCPFHTIREATLLAAPAGTRTIFVRGATPARAYSELTPLTVRTGETLQGDGETMTLIAGGGMRCAVFDCVVTLQAGARLAGFTVTGAAVEIPTGADGASVDHVVVQSSNMDGVYVRASAALSHVTARNNRRHGLDARTGTVTITDSHFDMNMSDGINADRAVTIDFRRGSASENRSAGIALQDSSTVTGARLHTLNDLTVYRNLGFGIDAAGTASVRLRNSTMAQNEVGLAFAYGSTNSLDIGTAADLGGNTLAGNVLGSRNIRSGLCLSNTTSAGMQVAEGDTWSACPPMQRRITGPFCVSQNTYSDIGYVQPTGATALPPVVAPTTCTVGP